MTMREDGSFVCDRDGVDVGNGGVLDALVVSDLDPDQEGPIRILHFCRDRVEDGKKVKGCASKVLSNLNLAHYNESKGKSNG